MNKRSKKVKGITLVALVITIIALLILAGVTIGVLTGENGLLNKAKSSSEESMKQTASEKINLKITNVQMEIYTTKQTMPTLQELADAFYIDEEIEYVITKNEVASIGTEKNPINVTGFNSFFTKLKEYPYEFEIDSSLRLASINGVKIAENNGGSDNSKILDRIESLETKNTELMDEIESLKTNNSSLKSKMQELENKTTTTVEKINITVPNNEKVWVKVANYPTGYNKNNTIVSGYIEGVVNNLGYLMVPFANTVSGTFADLQMKDDGIYMIVTSFFTNKSGKLFLQKY